MITVHAFGKVSVLTLSGNMELLNEFEKVFRFWLYCIGCIGTSSFFQWNFLVRLLENTSEFKGSRLKGGSIGYRNLLMILLCS